MVPLTDERDVDTLRQISQLLDRENQRLLDKIRELTAELARLRGIPHAEQLALALRDDLARARAQILDRRADASLPPAPTRAPQAGHGPRAQPALPIVDYHHELPPDRRDCPACGGTLTPIADQYETAERITTVTLTYQIERHHRQKYRCACNGAVVTAPAPPALIPGGRYAPAFAVGVAVAKYADHLPLERQVRMMARVGLVVDSQTLWDQLNALARHLGPTYEALGRHALAAPVIHVDETRWPILGATKPSAGTVWTVRTPTVAFYRILPGKSAEESRQVLDGYRGTAVVDGFAVYEVLARAGPGLTLAHCWAHVLRKYDEIADQWPVACDTIRALIGELYAIERLVPGPFPGDAAAQALRQQLRRDRAQPVLDQIWQWATGQAGLPRSDFGKAVRYMLERWEGLTRFVHDPRISLDNNAAERALRGPVVGRKNHYGSRSLRGTQVAALFYTLCETAHLAGVDPHAYLLHALNVAIATRNGHASRRAPVSRVTSTRIIVIRSSYHGAERGHTEEHGVEVDHVLTDNGREYCGRPLHHPFELFLAIGQVTHRRTEVGSPETNGFCERFHRTVKEEFFSVAFRRTMYESVAQLQADLDAYVTFYNRERVHQGYRTQGRTPHRAFCDGLVVQPTQEVTGSEAA